MRRSSGQFRGWIWGASILVHVGVAAVVTVLAHRTLAAREAEEEAQKQALSQEPIPIDLPPAALGNVASDAIEDRRGDTPIVTGGASVARLDTGNVGRGGDSTAAVPATNLSDRDERLHLSPDAVSHLDRDQIQRLRTAQTRASWEDRRATTNPMELTFLATGLGDRDERRRDFAADPSRGAKKSALASKLGGALGGATGLAQASGLLGQERTLDDGLGGAHGCVPQAAWSAALAAPLRAASTDLIEAWVITTVSWRRMS